MSVTDTKSRRVVLDEPGIYSIPAPRYHADPCSPSPSLNHSMLRIMLDQSPRHAWHAHPRLNPDFIAREPSKAMEEGTALHFLILGAGEAPLVVYADSFRTKAAQEQAETARSTGRVPVIVDRYKELIACATAVKEQIAEHPECKAFMQPGRSEVTLLWQEGPIWCRGLIDRLPDEPGAPMFDLKSTVSANPREWERKLVYDFATQAVFYLRGGMALLPVPPRDFRFIVFEREPPYGVSVMTPGATLLEAAEADVKVGVLKWARSLITDTWPGYTQELVSVEAPVNMLMRVEQMKMAAATQPLERAAV